MPEPTSLPLHETGMAVASDTTGAVTLLVGGVVSTTVSTASCSVTLLLKLPSPAYETLTWCVPGGRLSSDSEAWPVAMGNGEPAVPSTVMVTLPDGSGEPLAVPPGATAATLTLTVTGWPDTGLTGDVLA